MADAHQAPLNSDECRAPTLEDVAQLGRALNEAGARYVIIGGFAIRAAGFMRNTMDVDLLIETGKENEARVIQGLMVLPDKAARAVKPGEVAEYGVVRIGDEILVDLMKSACAITYAEAIGDAVWKEVEGVSIPFASPEVLWRMKQTHREKDVPDILFLRELLEKKGTYFEMPRKATAFGFELPSWLKRFLRQI
jgi:hypothetical protein